MRYTVTHIENGLTVATAEMPHMASASVGIWLGVGSRYEPAPLNGACHFIEHLLFKGTRNRSAREISQAVEGIGGYLNAFTSEEFTCFHARAGANRFRELLDVLCDMFLNSRFARSDISRERDVIKEEVAMYQDQPQQHVQELLNATLWPDQPLGRPITGTNETLDSLHRAHLLGYLRENYVSGSTVIAAAGRLRHDSVVRAIRGRLARVPRGRRPGFTPCAVRESAPRVGLCTRDIEQTQVALGIRTCSRHDPRRHATRLLSVILGENMSSRLFQIVREDRGLAYSIYSAPSFFHDTGDLVISAGLDTDNLSRTLRLVRREFQRICEAPVAPEEMRRAKDYVVGQIDLGAESTETQMNWIGEHLLSYGRIEHPETAKRCLRKVTAAEIRAVARDFLRPERMCLALVGPVKSAASVHKLFWN